MQLRQRSWWDSSPHALLIALLWGVGGTILQVFDVGHFAYLVSLPVGFGTAFVAQKLLRLDVLFVTAFSAVWFYGLWLATADAVALWSLYIGPWFVGNLFVVRSRLVNSSAGWQPLTSAFRGAGFVVPLAILFLVAPAGSTEMWQLGAAASDTRLALFATVLVVPLYGLAQHELLRQLPRVVAERALALLDADDIEQIVVDQLEKSMPSDNLVTLQAIYSDPVWAFDPVDARDYAGLLFLLERRAIAWKLRRGLAFSVATVALVLVLFFFAVTSAMVDPSVAKIWLADLGPSATDASWLGLGATATVGLQTSIMLASIAVAAFLASIVVEDNYARMISELLVEVHVDPLLILGMPYTSLVEMEESAWPTESDFGWEPLVAPTQSPDLTNPA